VGRPFWLYAAAVGSGIGARGLVSVISGERGTVRLAVVYIPRHTDYLCCGSWTELH
jgi:hypothetical protein